MTFYSVRGPKTKAIAREKLNATNALGPEDKAIQDF